MPAPDDLTAELERLRVIERAATKGPWSVTQRHGTDIADEGWSEAKIIGPDGMDIAATFISHLLENYRDGDDAEFIVTARTAMPLLLAAVEAVLKPHQPGRVVILGHLCKHHENHRFFSITSTEADGVRACPDCTATVYTSCTGCGPLVSVDACPVRAAITRELAGKKAGNDA